MEDWIDTNLSNRIDSEVVEMIFIRVEVKSVSLLTS